MTQNLKEAERRAQTRAVAQELKIMEQEQAQAAALRINPVVMLWAAGIITSFFTVRVSVI